MDTLLLATDSPPDALRDLERLQGTWNFVSGIRPAQLLIAGDHFTMKFSNGEIYMGTYRLDPTEDPAAMDMFVTEGPDHHRDKVALCIYELRGDRLTWCPSEPGAEDRPRSLDPCDDGKHLCLVLRHEPRGR